MIDALEKAVNPSLQVSIEYRTLLHGEDLTTEFDLQRHPQIADWIRRLAEHNLAILQNRGGKGVPRPPDGESLDRLVRAGVIFRTAGSDGNDALSLNPDHNLWLNVRVRRLGQPALFTGIPVYDEPEIASWLLGYFLEPGDLSARRSLSDAAREKLCSYGVLVGEPPPAEAFFPDPSGQSDAEASLASAQRTFVQRKGDGIPPPVSDALGDYAPNLPTGIDILWVEDAGTGVMYPLPFRPEIHSTMLQAKTTDVASKRREQWREERLNADESLKKHHYAVLRELIPQPQRNMLRAYTSQLVSRGYFPSLDDGQVALRAGIHNQETVASLHKGLSLLLSRILGETVIPSYCYLACYEAGATLDRHKDRPQCLYNLSVVFDMQNDLGAPEPWPIYVELEDGPKAFNLDVGDGLMYSGTDLWHWRDALPKGQRAIICFYHFVRPDFSGSLH